MTSLSNDTGGTGRILGLDIGSKRTGFAISDETRRIAFPRSSFQEADRKRLAKAIAETVEAEEVGLVVVGIPLDQFGEAGVAATEVRQFCALLRERLQVPVVEWDERFTTAQAERSLIEADVSRRRRKEVIDQVAAALLLQNYLDSQTSTPEE